MKVPVSIGVFLVVGLLAASQSGNIVRLGAAHSVAIAFWRLTLAALILVPISGRKLGQVRTLARRELALIGLAGTCLALHLVTWIASVQLTTVANAAILFSINPVLTAGFAFLIFRERISRRLLLAIAMGLTGIAVMGWADLSLAPDNLVGDALALLCSVFFTAYLLVGKRVRQVLPTQVYVNLIYGMAALVSLVGLVALDLPLVHYDGRTWLCFFLLALVPTLIGHTSFNAAIRYIKAGWLSALTVSEPLFAGLVAAWAWDEPITLAMVGGYLLIASSVVVLVLESPNVEG